MSIIIPVFHRRPEEAAIIGRMVLGYSELELMVAYITAVANDANRDDMMRAIFRTQSESSRLLVCDALIKGPLKILELDATWSEAKGYMKWCKKTRNQFAHCQWAETDKGIFFVNLDDTASRDEGFDHRFMHIDLPLLKEQEAYFVNTRELLLFLEHETQLRKGLIRSNIMPRPKASPQPNLYNLDVKYP